jgi:CRISPR-associated exonuclease Cas4
MFSEDDLLPISALQHLMFCSRQWALIHLEGQWAENRLTAEGRRMHERADTAATEVRGDLRVARGLQVRSLRLGLTGRADAVEFHRESSSTLGAVSLPEVDGSWRVFPVEYKRGKPKVGPEDRIQLCAQALCLEEMLGAMIPEGALYYGKTHRRVAVALDHALRAETEELALRLHEMHAAGITPAAEYAPKCEQCSLIGVCKPKSAGRGKSARRYVHAMLMREVADP